MTIALVDLGESVGTLRSKLIFGSERAIVAGTIADTINGLDFQILNRFNLHIHIGIKCTALCLIVAVDHHVSVGIAIVYVPVGIDCTCIVAIGIINWMNGRRREGTAEVVVPDITSAHTALCLPNEAHALTDGNKSVVHLVL